jgi:hypothetical protein
MKTERVCSEALRRIWTGPGENTGSDYVLGAHLGKAYAGRAISGAAALVVPVAALPPRAVGRRTEGFELIPHASLRFAYGGREWTAPAAALTCADPELLDAFVVLAADIHGRLPEEPNGDWESILAAVEEWQSLMAPRGRPDADAEVGLWGELWLLASSASPDRLIAGWRGPDGDAADFVLDGRAAEVKTARQRRRHHVSLAQVADPVGTHEAWLVSIWVGIDPIRGLTVPALIDEIMARVDDPGTALRRLIGAGYSPADRLSYEGRFVVLAQPEWYPVVSVPRVRSADPGVTQIRYVVTLDETLAVPEADAATLWAHFVGRDDGDAT